MPSELDIANRVSNLIHVFSGIYIWEFVTSLGFEWEIFTGRRPWRWSFAVYFTARILCLATICLELAGNNLTSEIDCNAWFRCTLSAGWFAVAVSSFLLVLRGVAIWGRDKVITTIAVSFWFTNMAAAIWSTTEAHATWNAQLRVCAITGTSAFRWSVLMNLFVDVSLLCIMFAGVLQKKNATRLWRMLYFQGIFWILTAICTEVPSVVLPFMNINDAWNLFFQVPHLVLMVIMSTRLYRDLFQYITDEKMFEYRHDKIPPHHNVQVAVHKTVEVDVDLRHLDEEQPRLSGYKPTISMRSQAQEEMEMMAAELQMKNDLQI